MNIHRKYICVVPCRSGSKGIVDKNIREFRGKPLFKHSLEHAFSSNYIKHVILWTDSKKYQQLSIEFPLLDLGLRELFANDLDEDWQYLKDLDKILTLKSINYDAFVLLRPTTPVRPNCIIDNAIKAFELRWEYYDSLRSVQETSDHPYKMWLGHPRSEDKQELIGESLGNRLSSLKDPHSMPRQLLPKVYSQDGQIDIIKRDVVRVNSSSGERVFLYNHQMTKQKIDIDNESDLRSLRENYS